MNNDRRRILGPNDARIPLVGSLKPSSGDMEVELTKGPDDIKKMFLKTGFISNANGSSYLEVEDTIIQVSVFGPRPIKGSFIDQASFSVDCKFLPHIPQLNEQLFNESDTTTNRNGRTGLTSTEQRVSSYIETALLPSILLSKYPKSTIDIHITIIENKLPLLNLINWIINGSSLALVDSGIELRDVVTSGHVRLDKTTKEISVDPSEPALASDSIDCLTSFMNLKNDEIVGLWVEGCDDFNEPVLEQVIDKCNEMSRKIRGNINSYLVSTT